MNKVLQNKTSRNIGQLFVSILLVFSGFYIFFNPMVAVMTSAVILGIFFIFMGVGYLIAFSHTKSYMLMALGILDILVGLLFIGNLEASILTISIIFALWCLFIGIIQTTGAMELKDMGVKRWKWLCVSGVCAIFFAFLIFFYPIISILTISFLMGFYLILYGIFEFVRYIQES